MVFQEIRWQKFNILIVQFIFLLAKLYHCCLIANPSHAILFVLIPNGLHLFVVHCTILTLNCTNILFLEQPSSATGFIFLFPTQSLLKTHKSSVSRREPELPLHGQQLPANHKRAPEPREQSSD